MPIRQTVCALGLVFLAMTAAMPARAQLGITAGLNFDSIDDIDAGAQDVRGTFDRASGYHAGVFYDLGAGLISVRPALVYRDLGTIDFEIDATNGTVNEDVDLSMIEFSLDLHANLVSAGNVNPYLLAGPVFALPRSEDADLDDALEEVLVSGVVGAGVVLNLGTIAVIPEFRYVIGLSGLTGREITFGSTTLQVDETQKVRSAQLRVGIRF